MVQTVRSLLRTWTLLALSVVLLAGCSISVPSDPDGTLDRVRAGELRVGISHNPPLTALEADAEPTGIEADLVRGFANQLESTVVWTSGSEAALVQGLEDGNLDLAVAGFRDDSPYTDEVGATDTYLETLAPDGSPVRHVMLVPAGENAFLTELEIYLAEATR
ncbi:ABC transporter substrate-binding protein [Pseudoclavibacter sp. AY1H1]|nr:ABC transporter substrate-binding protein [Pseudoclavibacter sp. AY1H1]